jgi:hypothetical protein
MTNPDYRDLCAELVEAYVWCIEEYMTAPAEEDTLIQRARALLDQPVAEGTKPVVDYSRVPEIATEAQIRSAAQYLVKKRLWLGPPHATAGGGKRAPARAGGLP